MNRSPRHRTNLEAMTVLTNSALTAFSSVERATASCRVQASTWVKNPNKVCSLYPAISPPNWTENLPVVFAARCFHPVSSAISLI